MSKGKYSEVVQAGMELLDENVPGWECRIDPEVLDLASCQFCVLGQIYGEYTQGTRELHLVKGNPYGFDTPGGEGAEKYYSLLTRAWLRVLRKRLSTKLSKISKRFQPTDKRRGERE